MQTSYKNLIIWQKSIELVKKVYQFTQTFPKEEIYELTSQIRRCAVSIPSNIAEEHTRKSKKELNYTTDLNEIQTLLLEVLKMLSGLIQSKNIELNSKAKRPKA